MAGKQRDVNCTQGDFFICIVTSSGSNTREKSPPKRLAAQGRVHATIILNDTSLHMHTYYQSAQHVVALHLINTPHQLCCDCAGIA